MQTVKLLAEEKIGNHHITLVQWKGWFTAHRAYKGVHKSHLCTGDSSKAHEEYDRLVRICKGNA